MGAINWSEELNNHSKRKHIALSSWIVFDQTEAKNVRLTKVASIDNASDCLTKSIKTAPECDRHFNLLTGRTPMTIPLVIDTPLPKPKSNTTKSLISKPLKTK